MGLGRFWVSSEMRVPSPPARITAFIFFNILKGVRNELLIFLEGGGSYEWLVAGENTGSRAARVEGRERICCDPPARCATPA